MFDIGFQEFILIGIVALVVVGPERLPGVAASVGRWVGKTRRFVAGVKSDFARELESGDLQKMLGDQKEQISELRSLVNSTRKDLESSTSEALASAKEKLDSAEHLTQAALDNDANLVDDDLPEVGTPVPVPEELNKPTSDADPDQHESEEQKG